MTPFFGQPITAESIERLKLAVTGYVKKQGDLLVDVTVPQQNISSGEFRLVVVIGHYTAYRLLISDSEDKAAAMTVPANATQIVIQDVPLLATQEFAVRMAPYFDQPITNEWVDRLIADISAYVKSRGELAASVRIPSQSIASGEFRIGVTIGRYDLRRLIFSDTAEKTKAIAPAPDAGRIVTQDMPLLATKEFSNFIAPYFGQPITNESVERLRLAVIDYVKKHDRLVVDATIPGEDLARGEVRIAVAIGRYSKLQFKGNRWFSNELLMSKLGIKPGDEIRASTLEQAVDWANTNPFRHIQVLVNTMDVQPGTADLDVAVQERLPVRVAASYDDTGNDIIGNNHYTGSLQLGNLWGLDHQVSYQYTTTDVGHLYEAQAGDYRAPLPWHDYIDFSMSYAVMRPTFEEGLFNQVAKNVVADLRYIKPIQRQSWSLEFSGGVDFKQVNNNLDFGGFQVLNSDENIAQFTGGLTVVRRDPHGSWVAAVSANFSPGDFNTKNTDASFANARYGSQARYVYGTFVLQRITDIPLGFQLYTHGQAQASSANLLGSEQMTIGGQATVRGYDERIVAGDQGVIVNQELRGPVWQTRLPFEAKTAPSLQTRLLAFWDYGRVQYKHVFPDDIPLDPLMSTGVGLRSNLGANNFSLSLDYGWQILRTNPPQPNTGRGDITATVAW